MNLVKLRYTYHTFFKRFLYENGNLTLGISVIHSFNKGEKCGHLNVGKPSFAKSNTCQLTFKKTILSLSEKQSDRDADRHRKKS